MLSPHVTKQVRLPKGGEVIVTLKENFDRVNFTLEGVRGEYQRTFTVPEDLRAPTLTTNCQWGKLLGLYPRAPTSNPRQLATSRWRTPSGVLSRTMFGMTQWAAHIRAMNMATGSWRAAADHQEYHQMSGERFQQKRRPRFLVQLQLAAHHPFEMSQE